MSELNGPHPEPMPAIETPKLAPPDYCDPVIEMYKRHVDRTLLRENLKLSVEERIRKADHLHASIARWQQAGKEAYMQPRESASEKPA